MKKLLLILPIIGGVVFGQLVSSRSESSENKPYRQKLPSGRSQGQLANSNLSPSQMVSHYLLSSQALFSKAIEESNTHTLEESKHTSKVYNETNQRVIELINEAITQATQAIIAAPQDARGYAQRGKIYQTIEKYLDEALLSALKDYQQAARLSPHQVEYYEQVAKILTTLNRSEQATEVWKKAAYLNPTDPKVWHKLAKAQAQSGNLTQAKVSYQRILSLIIDQEQKEIIKKELTALDKLLTQAGQQPIPSPITQPDLILPDQPPQLEASLTAQLIIAEPRKENDSLSGESQSNALSSTAILPAGETTLTINSQKLQTNSQVYLAALGDLDNQVLRVESKHTLEESKHTSKECVADDGSALDSCEVRFGSSEVAGAEPAYFTVGINKPLEKEIEFRWWIIP